MEEKITAWVARDKDGVVTLFNKKPRKSDYYPEWVIDEGEYLEIGRNLSPQVKWEDVEPTKVELTIKIKD